jgi:hypothetical protein
LLAETHPKSVVIWLNGKDLEKLGSLDSGGSSPESVYLSASMLGSDLAEGSGLMARYFNKSSEDIRMIYPYQIPSKAVRHLQRTKVWLRARKIDLSDERLLANTYFAVTIAGDAFSHLLNHFSRDYFVELIEHMVGRSMVSSVYPKLDLGPGQRFASKGAYLVKYPSPQSLDVEPISNWIVPY